MDANQFDHVAKAVGQGASRRRLLAGLLSVALAGSVGDATVSAKGTRHRRHRVQAQKGNSQNAKRCQKGGWATLAPREDPSTPFASQDACVSYGAKGGTIVDAVACLALGTLCEPRADICCQTVGSTTICASVTACGGLPDSVLCCRPVGQPCSSGCHCCGNRTCCSGTCC